MNETRFDSTALSEPENGGFMVKALYGRRGGPMNPATKTSSPVPKDKAEKVYDGVLKEKFGKGYTVYGEAAPAFTHVDGAVDTGRRPMLLTDCTESGPDRFVAADEWCGSFKEYPESLSLERPSSDRPK